MNQNKHILICLLILIIIIPVNKTSAQDIHFSQFYAAPLYLSPSFAGSVNGGRLSANYRNQWPEIPNAFVTYALAYDQYFPDLKSGIGLLFTRDQKGELNYHTSNIGLVYTYDIIINRYNHFRPGLEFQYSYAGIDRSKMITRDMIQLRTNSPMETVVRETSGYFDANFSVLFYNKTTWAGITITHLMRPNNNFGEKEKLPLGYSIFSGIKIINKGRLIKPKPENLSLAFNYRKLSNFSQLNIGMLGNKKNINLGLWYRKIPFLKKNSGSDAVIITLGYDYTVFNIGFSYDITISGLKKYTNGAMELALSFIFPENNVSRKKQVALPCPVF